jgi:HAD superfamily hydrolase (TIGR01549 family)
MAIEVVIFDVDGTLVDSNDLHARAWQRAFDASGYDLDYARIRAHIGMGGDKLVPALIGDEAEARAGKQLRAEQTRQFEALLDDPDEPKRLFPRVIELLSALKKRGVRAAIATSAESEKLERIQQKFGLDLNGKVDETVTASGVSESKPAPDLVCAALDQLAIRPEQAVMVGDTPYDANACRAAHVACIGVRSGGWSDTLLRAAGAAITYADTGELLASLDQALERAQRG